MEWKTISAKVSEEDYGAMRIICEREKIKINEFVAGLVRKETQKVRGISPDVFPTIGENLFDYNPESDTFTWSIHTGSKSPLVVSSKLSPHFVESIHIAMNQGISKRKKLFKQIRKNKTFVPDSIKRFKE